MRSIIPSCLWLVFSYATLSSASAQSISMATTASHRLGFSGAVVSIIESNRRWPVADRTFTLRGANGQVRRLPLHKGGGKAGNTSLNLFLADQDRYFVISERDCIEFDPIRVKVRYCSKRPQCNGGSISGPKYLGRFDWMNGYDPPKGSFQLAFRYLPAEDATESGSCPASK